MGVLIFLYGEPERFFKKNRKLMKNLLEMFDYAVCFLNKNNIKHEYTRFPSNAIILDVWYRDKFYVFHFDTSLIGISEVAENVTFDSRPDKIVMNEDIFKENLKIIFFDVQLDEY